MQRLTLLYNLGSINGHFGANQRVVAEGEPKRGGDDDGDEHCTQQRLEDCGTRCSAALCWKLVHRGGVQDTRGRVCMDERSERLRWRAERSRILCHMQPSAVAVMSLLASYLQYLPPRTFSPDAGR